jgi:hypothetical protein
MPLQGLPRPLRRLPLRRDLEAMPINFVKLKTNHLSLDHNDYGTGITAPLRKTLVK